MGRERSRARVWASVAALLAFGAGCGTIIGIKDITPPPPVDPLAACTTSANASPTTTHLCSQRGSCWLNPAPQGANLYHAWGTCGDAWTVGSGGTLVHWDGSTFSAVPSGVTADLTRAAGTSGSDVWFVGDFGTILHWDGSAVKSYSLEASQETLLAVWATAPDDAWASSSQHVFLHWDGKTWSHVPELEQRKNVFNAIWGSGKNDVWAVGTKGVAVHWDGTAWSDVPTQTTSSFSGISGSGPSDAWAVGTSYGSTNDTSFVFHWDGAAWSVADGILGATELTTDVWAGGANDVWVCTDIELHHFDGTSWNPVGQDLFTTEAGGASYTPPITGASLGKGQTLLVGARGAVYHGNDEQLTRLDTGFQESVNGLWGESSSQMWIAFDKSVGFWNGAQLTRYDLPHADEVNTMWGSAEVGLYVGGSDVWHSIQAAPAFSSLQLPNAYAYGLWQAGSSSPLWTVGIDDKGPVILRWDGDTNMDIGSWTHVAVEPSAVQTATGTNPIGFTAISGVSKDDIWAVADGGFAAHWDGKSWKMVDTGINALLHSVAALGADDVWAAGRYDVFTNAIIHYDGKSWSKIDSPEPPCSCVPDCFTTCGSVQRLASFGADAPGPWISTMTGTIFKWEGTTKTWVLAAPGVPDTSAIFLNFDDSLIPTFWSGSSLGSIRLFAQ